MLTHGVELLRLIKAAAHGVAGKAHADEAVHSAGRIAGGSLHGVGGGIGHTAGHHVGIGAVGGRLLHLRDGLHVLIGEVDGVQGDLAHGDAAALDPLIAQGVVHGGTQLVDLAGDLGRAQLLGSQCAEGVLQVGNELSLQSAVDLIPGVLVIHIAADLGVEQQRVGNIVGVHAVAAQVHGLVEAHLLVADLKEDGRGRSELIAHDLLGVDVINTLILAGVTAVGKALAHGLEGVQDALAQRTGKQRGLCGGVIGELAGLGADLHHLALLHDDHALTVGHGDAGAVGDNVVVALGVGGTTGDALLALADQNISGQCLAIEKLLPLIGQSATQRTDASFNKSHNRNSFHCFVLHIIYSLVPRKSTPNPPFPAINWHILTSPAKNSPGLYRQHKPGQYR